MEDAPDFFEAWEAVFTPLEHSRKLLGLLTGLRASGLLDRLRDGLDDEAVRSTVAPAVGAAMVGALVANGIAVRDRDRVRLTPQWSALVGPQSYASLATVLPGLEVEARLLEKASAGDTYWTMSSADRVQYACAVSPDPFRPEFVASVRESAASSPIRSRLAEGGRLLEAGCGVAGQLLTMLQAFPRLEAVGVEMADDLADEAERRALELGVADRFTVVRADVAQADLDADAFDFAHWSQFFFPEPSRIPALVAIHRALRPSGFVYAPQPFPFEAMAADPFGATAQEYSLFRVTLASWGVPERDEAALSEELVTAGFDNPHLVRAAGDVPRIVAEKG